MIFVLDATRYIKYFLGDAYTQPFLHFCWNRFYRKILQYKSCWGHNCRLLYLRSWVPNCIWYPNSRTFCLIPPNMSSLSLTTIFSNWCLKLKQSNDFLSWHPHIIRFRNRTEKRPAIECCPFHVIHQSAGNTLLKNSSSTAYSVAISLPLSPTQ